MHDKPKLQCTRDYGQFDMHEYNRPMHNDAVLMASMAQHGFMPSSPVQCVRTAAGTMKVIRGHHRIDAAKRLSLPVFFIVDESNVDLYSLEGGRQAWSITDFAYSRAKNGDQDLATMLEFQRAHGLTLGAAASLVGGESAGSSNKIKTIKTGTFHATTDMSHANVVVRITDHCRGCGLAFAVSTCFVRAVSKIVRVPEFDTDVFLRRVSLYPALMQKRSTVEECLREIEELYNYGAKTKRTPLAFRALEIARARGITFGRPERITDKSTKKQKP